MEVLLILMMMLFTAVSGAALGFFMGRSSGAARERNKKVQAICPCSHTWGEHKDAGKCLASVRIKSYSAGMWMGYVYHACACTKYHGPVVVNDEYFHPGYISRSEVEG